MTKQTTIVVTGALRVKEAYHWFYSCILCFVFYFSQRNNENIYTFRLKKKHLFKRFVHVASLVKKT